MRDRSKYIIICAISCVLIIIDQLTKFAVVDKLDYGESKEVISKFFYIHYVRNTGSAFSFLADKSWGIVVLSIISLIMSLVIMWLVFVALKNKLYWITTSGVLLFSGAIGNLIDRIRLNYVVDFLRIDYFGKDLPLLGETFPIFNFADICAVIGTILLIVIMIFNSKETDTLMEKIGLAEKESNDTESN